MAFSTFARGAGVSKRTLASACSLSRLYRQPQAAAASGAAPSRGGGGRVRRATTGEANDEADEEETEDSVLWSEDDDTLDDFSQEPSFLWASSFASEGSSLALSASCESLGDPSSCPIPSPMDGVAKGSGSSHDETANPAFSTRL